MPKEQEAFNKNNLRWFDILGDDCAWGGGLRRSKQGIWTYNVDS